MVVRARDLARKERSAIGLVGFQNMFCDVSRFDALFRVRLTTYFVELPE